jgi:tetratricopeptide (TPR) repeat protein
MVTINENDNAQTKRERLHLKRLAKRKKAFRDAIRDVKCLLEQEDTDKYIKLEPLIRYVVYYNLETYGEKHIKTQDAMYNLGNLLVILAQYAEAQHIFTSCLEYACNNYGHGHDETMKLLDALANTFYCQGMLDDAENCYRECLQLRRAHNFSSSSSSPPRHDNKESLIAWAPNTPDLHSNTKNMDNCTITTMNNLASVLAKNGKDDEAELLYEESLSIRRQELGDKHHQTLISMSNLGVHYFNRKKYDKAMALYLECLENRQQYFNGTEHHHNSLFNLALLYLQIENFEKARELFKQLCDNDDNNNEDMKQKSNNYLKMIKN